jgi:MFS family permease
MAQSVIPVRGTSQLRSRDRTRARRAAYPPQVPSPLGPALETIAPVRLGRSFRWLLASSIATNLGDGLTLAAGPLLVASLTRDPFLVSMAVFAQTLPALLFGVFAGVTADRLDRRRIMIGVNLGRSVLLAVLAGTIVSGTVSIAIVLVALFILGTAETFADVGGSSLLPRLVRREDLGIGNARLQGGSLLVNQLLGPPIGALLFALGMALPFVADAVCFALGALLVSRIVLDRAPSRSGAGPLPDAGRERAGWRADMAEGLRWLAGHPPMRTLALTIFAFNVTFGAAWAVLVLYAQERLGVGEVGFGLLMTAMAVGGLVGTSAYGRLERRFSLADIMRVGLLIETGTHLVLFGAHACGWNTTSTVVRQRAVPDELLGRVTGVYTVGGMAGIVIGTPIGGLLARTYGITAPFWFGFVGSAVLLIILWREFDHIVHAGDDPPPATAASDAATVSGS